MSRKSQCMTWGSILTLLVIVGAGTLIFRNAKASPGSSANINNSEQVGVLSRLESEEAAGGSAVIAQNKIERDRLVESWRNAIISQKGWLHTKVLYERNLDGGGVLPDGTEIPQDYIEEMWLNLDGGNSGTQLVSLMWRTDGELVQAAVYQNGIWKNFADNSQVASPPPGLPQDARLASNGGLGLDIIAVDKSENVAQEMVVFTYRYRQPAITLDEVEGMTISGGIIEEALDAATGQTISVATTYLLADGSEIFADKYTWLIAEVVQELPDLPAEYLNAGGE